MKGKRILSAVLSAALLLQLSPLAAFAEDTTPLSGTAPTAQTEPAPEDLAIDAQIAPEPTAETPAEPTAEPTPEASEEPTATPTPEPAAEPTASPAPEATAEPTAEPTATPDPAAEVQALIDALPDADAVTEDTADAVEEQLTAIDDAKDTLTDEQLAGLDFARYDAAANALLALWGKAPTDEVETLDITYTAPNQEGGWYIIDDENDLYWLATAAPKNVMAKLTADITINKSVLDKDGDLNDPAKFKPWTPIGTLNSPFKGTFDGDGHTISGLYFDNSKQSYVGLFGCVGNGGIVKNVNVTDSYMSGKWSVGGICGRNDGGTVQGCTSGCTVKGTGNSVGGICGSNEISSRAGRVLNCHNTGKVTGTGLGTGGVCGKNENSILQESDNSGKVSGEIEVGGVCGWNNSGTVKGCYNTGVVSGKTDVGGVCGFNSYNKGTVQESYNIGEVSGDDYVGGVCGQNQGTVKGCYNTGAVTGATRFGSVCGGGRSSTGCYYLDTSGTDSKGGISKTAAEFQSGEVAYLLQKALYDENPDATQVWGQTLTDPKQPYPVLGGLKVYQTTPCTGGYSNNDNQPLDHHYENGVCSRCGEHEPPNKAADGFYEIYDQWQLRWFANQVNTVDSTISARLMDDITINSGVLNENGELNTGAGANFTPWTLIGTNTKPFTGTFDGNNKTISGLYINASITDYVGLFGYIGTNGTVKDVTLADSYVSGQNYVGGICGQNKCGTLQNCHNTGKVSGKSYVGGVCGSNTRPRSSDPSSTIQECYNTGKVSGRDYVGGVCGQNNSATVKKSYNTNTVSGGGRVGGVCGENSGTVNGCYNTGKVSGTGFNVGGVCGYNSNILENSFNTGDVSGKSYVGGVCGLNGSTVIRCYNIGEVSSTNGSSYVGSVCGDGVSPSACYYLTNNPDDTVTDPAAKTAEQFASGDVAYQLQGLLGGAEVAQVWGQRIGTDPYPVLSSDSAYTVYLTDPDSPCKVPYCNTSSGILYHDYTTDGVCKRCRAWQEAELDSKDYYEITNQGQLRWFAEQVNEQHKPNINARLMNDITMDGTEWTPIGTQAHPFKGIFDGSGYTVSKLTCTDAGAEYVGLVGYAVGATIQGVTVQESSFNGWKYIGAVCGSIKDGTITGCTNSDSAVSGGYCLGGIAGYAGNTNKEENRTVKRCFNSGEVTVVYGKAGGIVGQANVVTVQDCGNTGAVTPADGYDPVYYGGIIGENLSGSTIENCYNADKNTAAKIYGSYFCDLSNCYYLPNDTGSSGSTVTGITAKTAAQFASGEVAYLLQNGREQAVWGQKIGTDDYPKLGGDKVYQSAPCPTNYSNTPNPTQNHSFDGNGYCTACGAPHIAYTVTIPASVELGGDAATIRASGVVLPDGKQLNVRIGSAGNKFTVTLDGTNEDEQTYTVNNGAVTPGDTVLSVSQSTASASTDLTFNPPSSTTYSGTYTGTVTFTVSVE